MSRMPLSAFLLCNGEPPSRNLARRLARRADFVVAADGGANAALRLGIRPRVIIGDLDSLSGEARRGFPKALVLRIRRQDTTDLEKALDFIVAQGIHRVTIAGIAGRRIDFTLGNLSVLWKYHLELEIVGDGWRAYPVRKEIRLRARRGTTVSIVPFGTCRGIRLRGLKYPLENATMKIGDIGVSNVSVRPLFSVEVRAGRLLVFVLDRPVSAGPRR